jgi:hypothetical protein
MEFLAEVSGYPPLPEKPLEGFFTPSDGRAPALAKVGMIAGFLPLVDRRDNGVGQMLLI